MKLHFKLSLPCERIGARLTSGGTQNIVMHMIIVRQRLGKYILEVSSQQQDIQSILDNTRDVFPLESLLMNYKMAQNESTTEAAWRRDRIPPP
jgi:hypothetical protein